MRDIKVIEENGYFMAFASVGNENTYIGEGYNREEAIKEANELADLLETA